MIAEYELSMDSERKISRELLVHDNSLDKGEFAKSCRSGRGPFNNCYKDAYRDAKYVK